MINKAGESCHISTNYVKLAHHILNHTCILTIEQSSQCLKLIHFKLITAQLQINKTSNESATWLDMNLHVCQLHSLCWLYFNIIIICQVQSFNCTFKNWINKNYKLQYNLIKLEFFWQDQLQSISYTIVDKKISYKKALLLIFHKLIKLKLY